MFSLHAMQVEVDKSAIHIFLFSYIIIPFQCEIPALLGIEKEAIS